MDAQRELRTAKLAARRAAGDSEPYRWPVDHALADIRAAYGELPPDSVNRGDWVGVRGRVMTTRRGELSIRVEECALLAKALRPPAGGHSGLADVETRYRQRYADLQVNERTREIFQIRHAALHAIRAGTRADVRARRRRRRVLPVGRRAGYRGVTVPRCCRRRDGHLLPSRCAAETRTGCDAPSRLPSVP